MIAIIYKYMSNQEKDQKHVRLIHKNQNTIDVTYALDDFSFLLLNSYCHLK